VDAGWPALFASERLPSGTTQAEDLAQTMLLPKLGRRCNFRAMKGLRYVYWQDGEFWLGYLEDYPDYMTQGESLQDLQEHLRDLYADLSGGHIPAVRKVAELEVA
jgi:hypothetical protein